jgi:telomerase reverse transcriptase
MLRHTIFVDRVVYDFASKAEVLELLEEHITENIVKVRNRRVGRCVVLSTT